MLRTQALEQLRGDSGGQHAKSGGLARVQRPRSAHRESSREPPYRRPTPAAQPRSAAATSPASGPAAHGERSPREPTQTTAGLPGRASRPPLIVPPSSPALHSPHHPLRTESARSDVDSSALQISQLTST